MKGFSKSILTIATTLLLSPAAFAQVSTVEDLEYPDLAEFEIPQAERVELENGLTLLLLEDHELPLIQMVARFPAGSRLEAPEKISLAGLTAEVMRTGGTESMTGDEIDDFLESRAASIELDAEVAGATANLSVLKEDLDEVLPIFAEILRQPAFDADKLEVAREAVIADIARQNDEPQSILFREYAELIYGADSPYARVPTYATAQSIRREDLVAFHEAHYHPDGMVLGVVGDFQSTEMLQRLRQSFGAWPAGPASTTGSAETAQVAAAPGVYFAQKSDVTQSSIAMGHLGIRKDDANFYAVEVMNEVLSGGFAGRLLSNVRSKKGLAYAVFGGVGSAWDHRGLTRLFMTTKTGTTVTGAEALLEEARRLTSEPPTAEEVEVAKESIRNSFVFNFDTREEILARQVELAYFGYPLDWLERYRDAIEGVTLEQVRQAAAEYVHPDEFRILVVGKEEGRDRPLGDLGVVTPVDITIPEPPTETVETTAAGLARGGELIEQAVEAMGGAEAIDGVRNTRVRSTGTVTTPRGEITISANTLIVYPDTMRQEMTLPVGTVVTVVGPEDAFLTAPMGTQAMADSQRQSIQQELARDTLGLLKRRRAESFEAVAAGQGEVDGTPVELVVVTLESGQVTLGIDPATGRILSQRFRGTGPTGAPAEMVKTYSDFRTVAGLTVPFASITTMDGEAVSTETMESVELNVEVPPDAFQRAQEPSADS